VKLHEQQKWLTDYMTVYTPNGSFDYLLSVRTSSELAYQLARHLVYVNMKGSWVKP
jgi:hypothetical protein